MTAPQLLTFAILTATMVLFRWGRFLHDIVALLALLGWRLAPPTLSRPLSGIRTTP